MTPNQTRPTYIVRCKCEVEDSLRLKKSLGEACELQIKQGPVIETIISEGSGV